jgi:hypothetical protein
VHPAQVQGDGHCGQGQDEGKARFAGDAGHGARYYRRAGCRGASGKPLLRTAPDRAMLGPEVRC